MIHLPFKNIKFPPAKLICSKALFKLRKIILKADGTLYTKTYYGDNTVVDLLRALSIHKTVLDKEDKPKCNYCESQIEKAAVLQVEHYRPKAKIDPRDTNGAFHTGYYWLGHEWSNLLLSCPKCNGRSAKGNRFPIRGVRALPLIPVCGKNKLTRTGCFADKRPLLTEDPLLLNPEIDLPENFLTFNLNGTMRSHGPDAIRGGTSKNIYNLNRPALVAERLSVWDNFKKSILLDISAHIIGEIDDKNLIYNFKKVSAGILLRREVTEEFTLWGRFLNDNINDFIKLEITDKYYQDQFIKAYEEVLLSI